MAMGPQYINTPVLGQEITAEESVIYSSRPSPFGPPAAPSTASFRASTPPPTSGTMFLDARLPSATSLSPRAAPTLAPASSVPVKVLLPSEIAAVPPSRTASAYSVTAAPYSPTQVQRTPILQSGQPSMQGAYTSGYQTSAQPIFSSQRVDTRTASDNNWGLDSVPAVLGSGYEAVGGVAQGAMGYTGDKISSGLGYTGDKISSGLNAVGDGVSIVSDKLTDHVSYIGGSLWDKTKDAHSFITEDGDFLVQEKAKGGCMPDMLGLYLMVMLLIIPMWNAFKLMSDPTYTYFCGKGTAYVLLASCILIISAFVIASALTHKYARKVHKTEQTVLSTGVVFLMLIACVLLCFSQTLSKQARFASDELMYKCSTGRRTSPLHNEYLALVAFRDGNKTCGTLGSLERCSGFNETYYSRKLKDIETDLMCSGFCYTPPEGINMTATGGSAINMSQFQVNTSALYPKPLFSPLRHLGTCQGMAARHLQSLVGDTSTAFLYEALFLVLSSVTVGYLMLIGLCMKDLKAKAEKDLKAKAEKDGMHIYGTMPTKRVV